MSTVWINHELLPKYDAKLSLFDHALLHGDGIREGMRLFAGQVFLLEKHLEQFARSAEIQRLTLPYSLMDLQQIIHQSVQANQRQNGYILLMLTRGPGTLALDPRKCESSLIVIVDEVGLYPRELMESGLQVCCLDIAEALPRTGTLSRGNLVSWRMAALETGCCEALLFGPELRTAIEAVPFLRIGDTWLTPRDSSDCVDPVYRDWIISQLGPVNQTSINRCDMEHTEEFFLASAAAGVTPVTRLDDKPLSVGNTTRQLQQLLGNTRDVQASVVTDD